jgi:hypothetical protein
VGRGGRARRPCRCGPSAAQPRPQQSCGRRGLDKGQFHALPWLPHGVQKAFEESLGARPPPTHATDDSLLLPAAPPPPPEVGERVLPDHRWPARALLLHCIRSHHQHRRHRPIHQVRWATPVLGAACHGAKLHEPAFCPAGGRQRWQVAGWGLRTATKRIWCQPCPGPDAPLSFTLCPLPTPPIPAIWSPWCCA